MKKEENELYSTILRKTKDSFVTNFLTCFNGVKLMSHNENIYLQQKGQSKRFEVIDVTRLDYSHNYVEKFARGAYLASICHPEASFDLSVAKQM